MKFSLEIVKQHPYASGSVVLALVAFLYVSSHKSASAASGAIVVGGGTAADPTTAAANAQVQAAGIASNTQLGLGALALQAQQVQAQAQTAVAQLAAQVALAQTSGSVQIAQSQTSADQAVSIEQLKDSLAAATVGVNGQVSMAQIAADSQNHLIDSLTGLISGLNAPKPTSAASGYTPFDPFNTANSNAPLLQGPDASIAQEINAGQVKALPGGVFQIVGDNNSPGGTYVSNNPLDTRWAGYVTGQYQPGGGVNFAA